MIVLFRHSTLFFRPLLACLKLYECTVRMRLVGRHWYEETVSGIADSHDHEDCNLKTHTVSSWKNDPAWL